MTPIRLIRDLAELSGTCYFEFLPGKYRGKCWNTQSVFLAEDVFGWFEPIIARHEPKFDHYAFVEIRRPTWELILAELDQVASPSAGLQLAAPTAGVVCRTEVAELAAELASWLREQLAHFESVSVLGI
jgi:hypothetical protein